MIEDLCANLADTGHFAPQASMRQALAKVPTNVLAEHLADRLARELTGANVLTNFQQLNQYLVGRLGALKVEEVRVLFLDTKNRLIADEVHQRGTIDACNVYVRELVKRTLELDATAIILAHNHPSGDPTPSQADVIITKQLNTALTSVDVALHDHVIVGGQTLSMRSKGYFQ